MQSSFRYNRIHYCPSCLAIKHEECGMLRCDTVPLYIYTMRCLTVMATKEEHPERYGWWLNELESLGISANRIKEVNDLNEISSLAG